VAVLSIKISQGGSAVTHLRWVGNFCNTYMQYFLGNLSVKEFRKTVNVWLSYDRRLYGCFLSLTVHVSVLNVFTIKHYSSQWSLQFTFLTYIPVKMALIDRLLDDGLIDWYCRRAHLHNCLEKLKAVVPLESKLPRHTTLSLLLHAQYLIKVCYFTCISSRCVFSPGW